MKYKYTLCIETFFRTSDDYQFNSAVLSFEGENMNINSSHTVKVDSDYKYYRSILNLSTDTLSSLLQRRLYVNFKSYSIDSTSPNPLIAYTLVYGISNDTKHDLDYTIYDYENSYEIINEEMKMHVPLNMNNNSITEIGDISLNGNLNMDGKNINGNITLNGNLNMDGNNIDGNISEWVEISICINTKYLIYQLLITTMNPSFLTDGSNYGYFSGITNISKTKCDFRMNNGMDLATYFNR